MSLRPDLGAADPAGLARPRGTRRTSPPGGPAAARPILRPGGDDAAGPHAARSNPHRSAQIASHSPRRPQPALPVGVDPVPEQHLGAVDVADPGHHVLGHQQGADRHLGPGDPGPGPFRVGVGRSGSGPSRAMIASAFRRRDQLAGRRSAQVRPRGVVLQPQPQRPARHPAPARPRSGTCRTARGGCAATGPPAARARKIRNRCLPCASVRVRVAPSSSAAPSANRSCRVIAATGRRPNARMQVAGEAVDGVALRHAAVSSIGSGVVSGLVVLEARLAGSASAAGMSGANPGQPSNQTSTSSPGVQMGRRPRR